MFLYIKSFFFLNLTCSSSNYVISSLSSCKMATCCFAKSTARVWIVHHKWVRWSRGLLWNFPYFHSMIPSKSFSPSRMVFTFQLAHHWRRSLKRSDIISPKAKSWNQTWKSLSSNIVESRTICYFHVKTNDNQEVQRPWCIRKTWNKFSQLDNRGHSLMWCSSFQKKSSENVGFERRNQSTWEELEWCWWRRHGTENTPSPQFLELKIMMFKKKTWINKHYDKMIKVSWKFNSKKLNHF